MNTFSAFYTETWSNILLGRENILKAINFKIFRKLILTQVWSHNTNVSISPEWMLYKLVGLYGLFENVNQIA